MSKIKEVGKGVGCAFGGIIYLIAGILGLIIHIWTILIAYSFGGLIYAIISLILPVIAQIYWGIRVWTYTGTFFNYYCIALVGYVVLWIVALGILAFVSKSEY